MNGRNLTLDELAATIVDSILEESFLNRDNLIPKVKALVRTIVDLKNIPKDYNAYENPTKRAQRIRTIEKKELEIKFWRAAVKKLDGANIERYYQEQQIMLIENGFRDNK